MNHVLDSSKIFAENFCESFIYISAKFAKTVLPRNFSLHDIHSPCTPDHAVLHRHCTTCGPCQHPILCLNMYIIYINTFMNAPNLHYGIGRHDFCAVGVAIEAAPPTMEQTASMPGVCTCIRHHPRTYHGGGTPAVWPGDILPSASEIMG